MPKLLIFSRLIMDLLLAHGFWHALVNNPVLQDWQRCREAK